MTPQALLLSVALLGAFIVCGGGYGLCYALARLWDRRGLQGLAYGCYALQCLITLATVAFTPLTGFWKAFVVLSCVAYALIPPVTWRALRLLHGIAEPLQ